MGLIVMVLRGRFRRHWKSWLALSILVAVGGGFDLLAAVPALLPARSQPARLLRAE